MILQIYSSTFNTVVTHRTKIWLLLASLNHSLCFFFFLTIFLSRCESNGKLSNKEKVIKIFYTVLNCSVQSWYSKIQKIIASSQHFQINLRNESNVKIHRCCAWLIICKRLQAYWSTTPRPIEQSFARPFKPNDSKTGYRCFE